jgi:hypothetical protein
MGVPYADAWGMPVDMALDMLGLSPNVTKSKQPTNNLASTTPPPPAASTTPRKLVAARRKLKTTT